MARRISSTKTKPNKTDHGGDKTPLKPMARKMMKSELAELARAINEAHECVVRSLRTSVEQAIVVGELLLRAKREVPYGQLADWIRTNTTISESSARGYMRLAKLSTKERQRIADLGVRDALDAIVKKAPETADAALYPTITVPVVHYTNKIATVCYVEPPPRGDPDAPDLPEPEPVFLTAAKALAPQMAAEELEAALLVNAVREISDAVAAIAKSRDRDRFTVEQIADRVMDSWGAAERKDLKIKVSAAINFLSQLRDALDRERTVVKFKSR